MRALFLAILSLSFLMACTKPGILDLHSDLLLRVVNNGIDFDDTAEWPQSTLRRLRVGGVTNQVYAVWFDDKDYPGALGVARAIKIISAFYREMEEHRDQVAFARTVAEARAINRSGRIAAWLWIEGGGAINSDPLLLRAYHALGVRGMTLTWSNDLMWAGAASDEPNRGLTDLGRQIVREMNRLGMIVDLSHVSDQTFYDALEVTTDPVIVSHSNCRAICRHRRNVTDDMLRALAQNGGVIGLNVYSEFVKPRWADDRELAERAASPEIEALDGERDDPAFRYARSRLIDAHMPPEARATLAMYLDHIDHVIRVAGPEHAGFGSDFDGMFTPATGIENASRWPAVIDGLRARGHSEAVIRGVMSENAMRVFEQVIDR